MDETITETLTATVTVTSTASSTSGSIAGGTARRTAKQDDDLRERIARLLLGPADLTVEHGALLGVGGFAAVYRARMADGRPAAVKLLKSPNVKTPSKSKGESSSSGQSATNATAKLFEEAIILDETQGPGIVELYGILSGSRMGLVTELLPLGDLAGLLGLRRGASTKALPNMGQRLSFLRDICVAVGHLFECGVLHRDLKPANVLLGPHPSIPGALACKLCDFGVAVKEHSPAARNSRCGTRRYLATELLMGETNSRQSEVFSLGVIAWELIVGKRAFAAGRDNFLAPPGASPDPAMELAGAKAPKDLVRPLAGCLDTDASQRPKLTQLITLLDVALIASHADQKWSANALALQEKAEAGTNLGAKAAEERKAAELLAAKTRMLEAEAEETERRQGTLRSQSERERKAREQEERKAREQEERKAREIEALLAAARQPASATPSPTSSRRRNKVIGIAGKTRPAPSKAQAKAKKAEVPAAAIGKEDEEKEKKKKRKKKKGTASTKQTAFTMLAPEEKRKGGQKKRSKEVEKKTSLASSSSSSSSSSCASSSSTACAPTAHPQGQTATSRSASKSSSRSSKSRPSGRRRRSSSLSNLGRRGVASRGGGGGRGVASRGGGSGRGVASRGGGGGGATGSGKREGKRKGKRAGPPRSSSRDHHRLRKPSPKSPAQPKPKPRPQAPLRKSAAASPPPPPPALAPAPATAPAPAGPPPPPPATSTVVPKGALDMLDSDNALFAGEAPASAPDPASSFAQAGPAPAKYGYFQQPQQLQQQQQQQRISDIVYYDQMITTPEQADAILTNTTDVSTADAQASSLQDAPHRPGFVGRTMSYLAQLIGKQPKNKKGSADTGAPVRNSSDVDEAENEVEDVATGADGWFDDSYADAFLSDDEDSDDADGEAKEAEDMCVPVEAWGDDEDDDWAVGDVQGQLWGDATKDRDRDSDGFNGFTFIPSDASVEEGDEVDDERCQVFAVPAVTEPIDLDIAACAPRLSQSGMAWRASWDPVPGAPDGVPVVYLVHVGGRMAYAGVEREAVLMGAGGADVTLTVRCAGESVGPIPFAHLS